ncbi:hypothetical protein CPC735_046060 [Coccidioides posadasii C735 delta SOWgp]|uniref:Uncharacterized protein n=1 Tax=Coccidioides posadasii (strain C735) TaxID=222929 RepID=C5PFA8_COCP7|nr:hypothetical protein CPC735_046060 [Coccidioides posadasii C735 delta SOWgp]EER23236.1 hypothetical protein CPC735_046060 [Coccidioides posadasii C735 delta SOWgp]|eukprot:XP_003065381.1 hypothetical protein CPC735_046060 [Coccidioides posadasii C735 delta SOWgp]
MALIQMRELLQFPDNGDNATDTVINGIHFNRSALHHFNYTLYSNGTLSNGSNCWLAFQMYKPIMFSNGTFINGTSCYSPIEGVGTRGSIGIAFASMFALTILFSLINLRKHGRRYLPVDKRWSLVGRRWQWYWMLFVGACGTISCFTSIDVDRDYLQGLAIILQSLFYYLTLPTVLAAVWESVRHWGSWQERQIQDRDNFAFAAETTREKQEFYLPLIFYLFAFLNFFLTIPRSWTNVQKQRSEDQQESLAKPTATDGRFKSASILVAVCLFLICYSLGHSLYRYKHRPQGRVWVAFYLTIIPFKFIITILLAGARIGFGIASAFNWTISPLKYNGEPGWLYGLGYTPVLLILIILNIYGYLDRNEDKELIRQRVERGRIADNELGIDRKNRKPHWWHRSRTDYTPSTLGLDADERLRTLVAEVGGGTATKKNLQKMVEMGVLNPTKYRDDDPPEELPAEEPSAEFEWPRKDRFVVMDEEENKPEASQGNSIPPGPKPEASPTLSRANSHNTAFSGETLTSQAKAHRVRSMLDI